MVDQVLKRLHTPVSSALKQTWDVTSVWTCSWVTYLEIGSDFWCCRANLTPARWRRCGLLCSYGHYLLILADFMGRVFGDPVLVLWCMEDLAGDYEPSLAQVTCRNLWWQWRPVAEIVQCCLVFCILVIKETMWVGDREVVFMEKARGPIIEPWGTPAKRLMGLGQRLKEETGLYFFTWCWLGSGNGMNQCCLVGKVSVVGDRSAENGFTSISYLYSCNPIDIDIL